MEKDLKFIKIEEMQEIIEKDEEEIIEEDKMTGIIEKFSFDIIPHMIVIVGEERIWLEGSVEAFEGEIEDYSKGKTIEIRAKNVGTIGGNCDLGKLESIPLYIASRVCIK